VLLIHNINDCQAREIWLPLYKQSPIQFAGYLTPD